MVWSDICTYNVSCLYRGISVFLHVVVSVTYVLQSLVNALGFFMGFFANSAVSLLGCIIIEQAPINMPGATHAIGGLFANREYIQQPFLSLKF